MSKQQLKYSISISGASKEQRLVFSWVQQPVWKLVVWKVVV